jgi:WD40 repeat protein
MPVQPRVQMKLPFDGEIVGLGLAARFVVVQQKVSRFVSLPAGAILLCDTRTGSARVLQDSTDSLNRAVLSHGGRWLALAGANHGQEGARLIDLESGDEYDPVARYPNQPIGYCGPMVFSPDDRSLAIVCESSERNILQLYDLKALRQKYTLPAIESSFAFSPDGTRLVTQLAIPPKQEDLIADYVVWDVETGHEVKRHRWLKYFCLEGFTTDNSGLILSLAGFDHTGPGVGLTPAGSYRCVNIADGHTRWSIADVRAATFVSGGRQMFLTRWDERTLFKKAFFFDVGSGRIVAEVPWLADEGSIRAAPTGRSLLVEHVSESASRQARNWLVKRFGGSELPPPMAYEIFRFEDGSRQPWPAIPYGDALFSPDGESLAVIEPAGRLDIWDVPARKPPGWFAVIAGVLALPIAWLARRRLRREAA